MAARILILVHESDPFPGGMSYLVTGLWEAWVEAGLDVRIARGLSALEPADLVIPHLDVTVTPPEWREALDSLGNVANRGVYDISKRAVSEHLVTRDSDWKGPVIVKTDLNSGGRPEIELARRRLPAILRYAARAGSALARRLPAGPGVVRGNAYRVFGSLGNVPDRVFDDPRLVVERFLPEREGDDFFIRWYIFAGDRYRSMRVRARSPIVKQERIVSRERGLPIPEEVHAFRERHGLDIGKIDFVLHEGRPVILDVARTPGDRPPPTRLEDCRPLAQGVFSMLGRPGERSGREAYRDVDA